jgi:hypothetical protein
VSQGSGVEKIVSRHRAPRRGLAERPAHHRHSPGLRLLVTGIVSIADAASTGRLAAKALLVFTLMLVAATVYAILASLGLLHLWPIDPEAGAR